MGRWRDAYQALLGRTSSQVEMARMRTEWASLMIDVANLMDKLAQMIGRVAKRETRKAVKKLTPTLPTEAGVAPGRTDRRARKAAMRRRRLGTAEPIEIMPPEPEEAEA